MADQNTFGIAGLLGWPVAHSRSPVIHNHWLAHYRIPGRYMLFPVPPEKLEAAVRGMAALGLRDCNVIGDPSHELVILTRVVEFNGVHWGACHSLAVKRHRTTSRC